MDAIGGAGLQAALGELRGVVEAAGRDASKLQIVPIGILPDPDKLDDFTRHLSYHV